MLPNSLDSLNIKISVIYVAIIAYLNYAVPLASVCHITF